MKKLRLALGIFVIIAFLIGLSFYLIGVLKPKSSGVIVMSTPASTVYINGEEVGRTPYDTKGFKPGEVVLRLVPDSFDKPLIPYETKIQLVAGVQTLVKRNFAKTKEESSGGIISFEKIEKNQTEIAVVSTPDTAQVKIDGQVKGFTPYKTSSILPGEHSITVSFQGYKEEKFDVKVYEGYRLTAVVDLAKSLEVEQTPSSEEKVEEKVSREIVEIIATPVGYLRVRREPSTLGEEVGRVNPGERYEIIETDERTGWYKIEYEKGKEGWISNQYAKKVVDGKEGSPAPTPKLTPTSAPTSSQTPTATPTPKI